MINKICPVCSGKNTLYKKIIRLKFVIMEKILNAENSKY